MVAVEDVVVVVADVVVNVVVAVAVANAVVFDVFKWYVMFSSGT